ncbi:hypothetical protein [Chenggangzhangella methanolivorans]|uniref:Uncharacterized protein n=1 Tax=Chenggangzhangella methanolivorans TaxID=1437009 RepID=A0A9E6RCK1_9HYPH|nr:hypothetical protein [Chenggangzhangella methanolivorans]QZO01840.1 hypothetical protein K6K41_11075 [Chenggangzhangella methanolivorans]
MGDVRQDERLIEGLKVIETTETDNVLRWDGSVLYVEHDVYHNGQLVHRKYRRKVTAEVAKVLLSVIAGKA